MCCPTHKVLSQAKLLFVLGQLSVELPTDITVAMRREAAEIIIEIDRVLRMKCWWCWWARLTKRIHNGCVQRQSKCPGLFL